MCYTTRPNKSKKSATVVAIPAVADHYLSDRGRKDVDVWDRRRPTRLRDRRSWLPRSEVRQRVGFAKERSSTREMFEGVALIGLYKSHDSPTPDLRSSPAGSCLSVFRLTIAWPSSRPRA